MELQSNKVDIFGNFSAFFVPRQRLNFAILAAFRALGLPISFFLDPAAGPVFEHVPQPLESDVLGGLAHFWGDIWPSKVSSFALEVLFEIGIFWTFRRL